MEEGKKQKTSASVSSKDTGLTRKAEVQENVVSQVTQEETNQFLIKEFERLYEFKRELMQTQESRLNVYLTSVAGGIAALGVSTQIRFEFIKEFPQLILFIEFMITACIFLFGVITFFRLIERSFEVVVATRAINSIRSYFVNPEIGASLSMIGEKEPPFAAIGFLKGKWAVLIGLPQIVALVNSAILTLSIVVLLRLNLLEQPTTLIWIVGFLVFAAIWLCHTMIYFWRVKTVQDSFQKLAAGWKKDL